MRILLFALLFISFFQLSAESAFEAFKKKDFAKAEEILLKENAASEKKALSYYNLGVVSEKEGKTGFAVYYYLQALQYAPEFKEARHNLEIIAKSLNIKIPEALLKKSEGFWGLFIFFIFSLYLFTALLIYFLWKPNWKIKIALIPALMVFILASTMFFFSYKEANSTTYGVSLFDSDLKSGPDESMTTIGKLKRGEIILILENSGNWIKAESFQDRTEGWINAEKTKKIR